MLMSRAAVKPARKSACRLLDGDEGRGFPRHAGLGRVEHMGVRVDQARQHRRLAEIDHLRAGRNLDLAFRADLGDAIALRAPRPAAAASAPLLLSNSWPARTATTPAAGTHLMAPPSDPKHGCAPAPRHGLPGPNSCAASVVAKTIVAAIADAANNADLPRMRNPPPDDLKVAPHRRCGQLGTPRPHHTTRDHADLRNFVAAAARRSRRRRPRRERREAEWSLTQWTMAWPNAIVLEPTR